MVTCRSRVCDDAGAGESPAKHSTPSCLVTWWEQWLTVAVPYAYSTMLYTCTVVHAQLHESPVNKFSPQQRLVELMLPASLGYIIFFPHYSYCIWCGRRRDMLHHKCVFMYGRYIYIHLHLSRQNVTLYIHAHVERDTQQSRGAFSYTMCVSLCNL